METQKLTRAQVKEIYDIACPTWQSRIEAYVSKQGTFADFIEFDDEKVIEMFDAATASQLPVLEKLLKRPESDKFNEEFVYIYKGVNKYYKLHRICEGKYAWVDLFGSRCYANGIYDSAGVAIKSCDKDSIIVLKSKSEVINYFKSL